MISKREKINCSRGKKRNGVRLWFIERGRGGEGAMVERNELLRMNSNVHPYGPPITVHEGCTIGSRSLSSLIGNTEELEANQGCVGRIGDISKVF